jgi:hypothetical protein
MKVCKKCGEPKPLENYYRSGKGKRRGTCVGCYRDHRKVSDHKPESRFKKYKRDARRRSLEFKLSREQFFSFHGKSCRYCGVSVTPISLDRIDNNQGYLIENVDACCHWCNRLKHIFGETDFLTHIEKICNYQIGKNDDKQESLSQKVSEKHTPNTERG